MIIRPLIHNEHLIQMLEEAYRDGFDDGADHGNLDYKYPPENVAFILWKKTHIDAGFVCLSRQELKLAQQWEDADYDRRTKENQWKLDADETAAEAQPPPEKVTQ